MPEIKFYGHITVMLVLKIRKQRQQSHPQRGREAGSVEGIHRTVGILGSNHTSSTVSQDHITLLLKSK